MLKRQKVTMPFYMDPWFWVKLLVFIIFAIFLVWPFSSIIINAFKSSKVDGFTMANFQKFFQKKYYYGALKNSVSVSVVPSLFAIVLGVPMAYLMTRYNVAMFGVLGYEMNFSEDFSLLMPSSLPKSGSVSLAQSR